MSNNLEIYAHNVIFIKGWVTFHTVFSIGGSKQNVKSFWTPVSESVFYALSHGSLGFALHGSFFNHFLIGWFSSTANKNLWNKWLIRLPWRTKCRLPCERAWKTVSETCIKSEFTSCLRPPIEKTSNTRFYKLPAAAKIFLGLSKIERKGKFSKTKDPWKTSE